MNINFQWYLQLFKERGIMCVILNKTLNLKGILREKSVNWREASFSDFLRGESHDEL